MRGVLQSILLMLGAALGGAQACNGDYDDAAQSGAIGGLAAGTLRKERR